VSYLFDTTVAIDWSVDHPGVREVVEACFAETGDLYTCDVILCEALSGGSEQEREVIRRFLDALGYVAIDPDGAAHAGELRRGARRSGGHSLATRSSPPRHSVSAPRSSRGTRQISTGSMSLVIGYGSTPA
jgi:predicted nucleic acid-binding protein